MSERVLAVDADGHSVVFYCVLLCFIVFRWTHTSMSANDEALQKVVECNSQ